jgi:uncharacterized protein (TIGR03435 family)
MLNNRILASTITVVLCVTTVPGLRAQSAEKFEVASVRRVEIPRNDRGVPVFAPTGGVGTSDPGRIAYHGTWLKDLIAAAFDVRQDQISGPSWLDTERYDIVATIPMGATKDQFNLMLRNLLIERFRLRSHMDLKVRPIYELRVRKNGPKFKETERRADDATVPPGVFGAPDADGCPTVPPNYQGTIGRPGPAGLCWTAQDVPIAVLVGLIDRPAGRPVMDETGLTGRYDFKIYFEPINRATAPGAASDAAPSVFTAVEKLGLKLESATRSFPQLIIDSMEREPTEN